MDSKLYNAAFSGDIDFLSAQDWSFIFEQETVEKNSALHLAAEFKKKQFAEKIIDSHPQLQYKQNSKDDTPLHIAARVGCLEIAKLLASGHFDTESQQDEANRELLTKVNLEKDTALHIAVRNGHFKIMKLLIEKEKELTKFVNANGESPLFLAVDRNIFGIASCILQADPNCSYQGRKRMNVLHAAILRSTEGDHELESSDLESSDHDLESSNSILDGFPFAHLGNIFKSSSLRFLAREGFMEAFIQKFPSAIKESDEFGWTPLHYAAFFGNTIAVELLLKNNDEQMPARTYVYDKDKEGLSALHIAAQKGQVQVMKQLTKTFPDICELVDERGRTALHVAVENGRVDTVQYVLKTPSLERLINVQDTEENTSLHLAAIHGHHEIVRKLLDDTRVDKAAMNKEGFTAIEIIESNMKLVISQKDRIATKLRRAGGLSLEKILTRENRETENVEKKERGHIESMKDRADEKEIEGMVVKNLSHDNKIQVEEDRELTRFNNIKELAGTEILVATIIATVTFAAGFTMPGGYKSDNGMAVLSRKTAFKSFLISDTIAFCFSASSMFYYYLDSGERSRRTFIALIRWTRRLTFVSIFAMVIAFISGTNVVLVGSSGLAIANIAVGCCFFLFYFFFLYRFGEVKILIENLHRR